jgi:poly(A) polymerase
MARGIYPLLDLIVERPSSPSCAPRCRTPTAASARQAGGAELPARLRAVGPTCAMAGNPLAPPMHPFPALQEATTKVFESRIGDISGRGKLGADMREIWMMQPRFDSAAGHTAFALIEQPRFRAGFDFLRRRADVGEVDVVLADWWQDSARPATRARDLVRGPRAKAPARRARAASSAAEGGARAAPRRAAPRPAAGRGRAELRRPATPRASAAAAAASRRGRAARRRQRRLAGPTRLRRRMREPVTAFVGLGANLGDPARPAQALAAWRPARHAARAQLAHLPQRAGGCRRARLLNAVRQCDTR